MAAITEHILEIQRHYREVHVKHSYYLMAVSAAAIAFSVQKTYGVGFAFLQIPLGLSVLLWSFSFLSGCLFTRKYLDAFYKLVKILEIHSGDEELSKDEEDEIGKLEEQLGDFSRKASRWGEIQFYTLVSGGVAFLLWHLLEMGART